MATSSALTAVAHVRQDGRIELRSPAVGVWRCGPRVDSVVVPGSALGGLVRLGTLHRLVAPREAAGQVVELPAPPLACRPVQWGEALLSLDPESVGFEGEEPADAASVSSTGLVLRSPSSGRFYLRPAPDAAPFVEVGGVVQEGQSVALLEVMKTFNRVLYGGPDLPPRARVVRVVPENESDVAAGDPLLEIEAAD